MMKAYFLSFFIILMINSIVACKSNQNKSQSKAVVGESLLSKEQLYVYPYFFITSQFPKSMGRTTEGESFEMENALCLYSYLGASNDGLDDLQRFKAAKPVTGYAINSELLFEDLNRVSNHFVDLIKFRTSPALEYIGLMHDDTQGVFDDRNQAKITQYVSRRSLDALLATAKKYEANGGTLCPMMHPRIGGKGPENLITK